MPPSRRNTATLKVGYYLTKSQKSALLKIFDNKEISEFLFWQCYPLLDREKSLDDRALPRNGKLSEKDYISLQNFAHLLHNDNRSLVIKKIKKSSRSVGVDAKSVCQIHHTFNALKVLHSNLKNFNNTIDYKHLPIDNRKGHLNLHQIPTLTKNVEKCIIALSKPNKVWLRAIKKTQSTTAIIEHAIETAATKDTPGSDDFEIFNMINAAMLIDYNPQIPTTCMYSIKFALGEDLFNFLVDRYNLVSGKNQADLNNQTFDYNDLRMIIIGSLQHCKTDWWENKFIKNLLLCLNHNNLEKKEYGAAVEQLNRRIENCRSREKKQKLATQLVEKLNIPEQHIQKLKETAAPGTINEALMYVKEKINAKWQFLIPVTFKYNNKFARDLNTITSICEAHKWQEQKATHSNSEDLMASKQLIQLFASNEFLFHKLSSIDCRDGSVIPIIEANGHKEFYKVKHLTTNSGLNGCFALLPLDPQISKEIKVIFKPKDSLAVEIIDTENYIQQQEFEKNKEELLNNLNSIISDFKETVDKNEQHRISLNIGGYGSGGTLAQCLTKEIIFNKANCATPKSHLQEQLNQNIETQCEHELNLGRKIKNLDQHKSLLEEHLLKEFIEQKPTANNWLENRKDLLAINNFRLSTVNSGGVSKKMRNQFIQSLYLLKKQAVNNPDQQFSINCDKLMSKGDPVQITGGTDLAAYIPGDLMPTILMQFDNKEDNYKSYKRYLLEMVGCASLIAIQYVVDKTTIVPGWVTTLTTAIIFNLSEKPKDKIAANCKALLSKAKNTHNKFHLNKENNHFLIMSNHANAELNINLREEHAMNKLLTSKIPIFSSKPYQSMKKYFYDSFCSLKEKYHKHKEPLRYSIDHSHNQTQVLCEIINKEHHSPQQTLSPPQQAT